MESRTQPNRLTKRAQSEGITVIELIERALKAKGSQLAAARFLGVTPNAVRYHLKRAGFTTETQIVLRATSIGDKS